MRISFDLDDTLICYREDVPREPPLSWFWRLFLRDEPLRRGTPVLLRELQGRGHEIWIYTTSNRSARSIHLFFRAHGVRIARVVNGCEHAKSFGHGSVPTKRPHAFEIDVHVDDSEGVAIEGAQYGFNVLLVEPSATDWAQQILAVIDTGSFPSKSAERPEHSLIFLACDREQRQL